MVAVFTSTLLFSDNLSALLNDCSIAGRGFNLDLSAPFKGGSDQQFLDKSLFSVER